MSRWHGILKVARSLRTEKTNPVAWLAIARFWCKKCRFKLHGGLNVCIICKYMSRVWWFWKRALVTVASNPHTGNPSGGRTVYLTVGRLLLCLVVAFHHIITLTSRLCDLRVQYPFEEFAKCDSKGAARLTIPALFAFLFMLKHENETTHFSIKPDLCLSSWKSPKWTWHWMPANSAAVTKKQTTYFYFINPRLQRGVLWDLAFRPHSDMFAKFKYLSTS